MLRLWRALQRRMDIYLLWPSCKKIAEGDRLKAEYAFHLHMTLDHAYDDLDDDAKIRFVKALPY